MSTCLIKAEAIDYAGCGEYWVSIGGKPAILVDENLVQIVDAQSAEDEITPDDITGVLGQLMDEVDLPNEIYEQVHDIYSRAVNML